MFAHQTVPHPTPTIDPLQSLAECLQPELKKVGEMIVSQMASNVPLIPQLASYLVASGGKRLRPLLTLASAQMCGYVGERHCALAACVEFIHTATLLHDDVVDSSDLRRGQPSANAIFGNEASVLVGDFLFARAFQLMVADGSLEVLKILSSAAATIAEGEVQQLSLVSDETASVEAYLEVAKAKTAALFAAATEIGAVLGERPEAVQQALANYGLNLGIAFQIVDDILDYSANQAALGKTVGDDFFEGKMTLPVILALQTANPTQLEFWRKSLGEVRPSLEDLAKAQTYLTEQGALQQAHAIASDYGAIAKTALSPFPDSTIKTYLLDLVDFTLSRSY